MKDRPEPFSLQNGLLASIAGLEDPSSAGLVKACQSLDLSSYPACIRQYLVLTVQIGSEKVHIIYQCSGENTRRNYALTIKQKLMRKRWEILHEASFVVYNDVLYEVNEAALASFEYAIRNKVSPAIAILVTPQPANGKGILRK